jgi:hypothetical protein
MDKYYTPEIEEFYVGFEYETSYLQDYDTWKKEVLEKDDVGYFHSIYFGDAVSTEFRVKYLDKEDIESLGWFHKYDDFSFGEFIKSKNEEVDYHLTFDYDNKSLIVGLYNSEDTEFYDNIFIGNIKNKSELKKLLKQLQIG